MKTKASAKMKPLYTVEEFNIAKYSQLLPLECKHCHKIFFKSKKYIKTLIINQKSRCIGDFCSRKCNGLYTHINSRIIISCTTCGKITIKNPCRLKNKSGKLFCCKGCASTYSNIHKTTGYIRSKFEAWIEQQIRIKYPELILECNNRKIIGLELDLYIPSLNLAFEFNGIFHYEPIFGQKRLTTCNKNDKNKTIACANKRINLCIIDISSINYFKPERLGKYIDIVTKIIDERLESYKLLQSK